MNLTKNLDFFALIVSFVKNIDGSFVSTLTLLEAMSDVNKIEL